MLIPTFVKVLNFDEEGDGNTFVKVSNIDEESNGNTFVKVPNFDKGSNGNVFINSKQYFANVPEVAWNFYIGGYQPSQKWLKDRKGRELSYEDILHYQKIIVALSETDRIMKEIDKIEV